MTAPEAQSSDLPGLGKIALVTGGSRGIGAAICRALAQAGSDVAVGYRTNAAAAEGVCAQVEGAGRKAVTVRGDVRRPEDIEDMVCHVRRDLGEIDIFVSNAGRMTPARLADIDASEWDEAMAEHARAAFLFSKKVIPGMERRSYGRILFISSISAYTGGTLGPHYSAAKAALLGLMHSLAAQCAKSGITVNSIAPSLIETGPRDPGLIRQIPVARFGTPAEVAVLAAAIIHNGYITGQTILIDGGQRMN
jgi:3-oxoacyl-[acyl-carrier protein] reductase